MMQHNTCHTQITCWTHSDLPAPIDSPGASEWLPVPAAIESTGTESCLHETSLMLQEYAYLWEKGYYSISIFYALNFHVWRLTKNVLISVILYAFFVVNLSKHKCLTARSILEAFFVVFFFCFMESDFDQDIKVLRSHLNETLSWMTSVESTQLIKPNPSTWPQIFIKDQFNRNFFCLCLSFS